MVGASQHVPVSPLPPGPIVYGKKSAVTLIVVPFPLDASQIFPVLCVQHLYDVSEYCMSLKKLTLTFPVYLCFPNFHAKTHQL